MRDINILKNNNVNIEKSLELFGDMETYDQMLGTFLTEIDNKLSNITKYMKESNMPSYAILVHSLKNDAKYFGFEKLADLSYRHEIESKSNNVLFVKCNYDELMTEAKKMVSVVKEYLGDINTDFEANNTVKDKTVLVVDDSDVISNFIKKVFTEYNIIVARDGFEAITIIETTSKVCGMLLDLNMPNVDGFSVLDYMQNHKLLEKIPTSIITGVNDDETIKKAFEYNIVDVLKKPFNEASIRTVIEKTLRG